MRAKIPAFLAVAALISAILVAPAAGAANHPGDAQSVATACDYACLTGFVDQYLAALVAHDPSRLPLAAHVRSTENTITLRLGDALWGTISGMGTYKVYFADPPAGEVGCECTIRENGSLVDSRRPVESGEPQNRGSRDCGAPRPTPLRTLKSWAIQIRFSSHRWLSSERVPRAQMLNIANRYLRRDRAPFG